jgi:diaminopropionate ammonia-lyase
VTTILTANPAVDRTTPYPDRLKPILSRAAGAHAAAEIASWPGYAPTPLVDQPELANEAGVARVVVKDESGRFGLGSFKALGGAYALGRILAAEVSAAIGGPAPSMAALADGVGAAVTGNITATCATDGNHGRSVAWGAAKFGCKAVIYVHGTVSQGRRDAIARFGASIEVVPGTYDDAVRACAADAARLGRRVVSDTSWDGYRDVPRDVMQGYGVMVAEALDLWDGPPPTHVFVPGGVGGVAASVVAECWERFGPARPVVVVVEPTAADCLRRSAEAGLLTAVGGDLDTIMAGLACGEPSPLAWEILSPGADAFLAIDDDQVAAMMRRLAGGRPPIVSGESGAAAPAGLAAVARFPSSRRAIRLDRMARVLCVSTEGATDPEVYARIVGVTPAS